MYLQRHLTPEAAQRVLSLQIPGVYARREYRRYYPTGEVTSHLLGFTDIDDQGQEGLERAFNDPLAGQPGAKQVIQDRLGRVVEDVEVLKVPEPGKPLYLSIDRRIQFLAYRALKAAVLERQAAGASAVVVDVRTGEILAMVNQPAGNPNDRTQLRPDLLRNRAVTDVFEPGSTAKALSVALALERGVVKPTTPINTSPGTLRIGRYTVTDVHNAGSIDVTRVISKSSNVGTSKIAFLLPAEQLWRFYDRLGFGKSTGLFKVAGEQPGVLRPASAWGGPIGHANHSFGYGFSVTALQLAQAYTVLAADGLRRELSIVRREVPPAGETRLLSAETTRQMRLMMEQAVSQQGTGAKAMVAGYRVAGKTGTARKVVGRRYTTNHYRALFAGMVPATRPRLVGVIMVDDPRRGGYYGGAVAAPIFSDIMAGALRILNVPPDAVPDARVATTAPAGR
jgi:cell division protein FtsI (penicillin-binding protein 3)